MVGLEINFKEFLLGDVLQFLARVKKSGLLRISGAISGEVYLKDGFVVHATDGSEEGMEALINLSLIDLDKGSFESNVAVPKETISEDLGKLTQGIEKRRIEFQEIKKKLPPMDTVLAKSTRDLESAVALRRTDWQILALIDGKRNLGDVIAESKIGGYEAAKTIVWLKEQELIYDPEEAERVMSKFTNFLKIFFDEFGKSGLNLFKHWANADAKNMRIIESLNINEENLEIKVKPGAELNIDEIENSLNNFKGHMKTEGQKIYGKVLFKKKWQIFEKKITGE